MFVCVCVCVKIIPPEALFASAMARKGRKVNLKIYDPKSNKEQKKKNIIEKI